MPLASLNRHTHTRDVPEIEVFVEFADRRQRFEHAKSERIASAIQRTIAGITAGIGIRVGIGIGIATGGTAARVPQSQSAVRRDRRRGSTIGQLEVSATGAKYQLTNKAYNQSGENTICFLKKTAKK
jgi:hypothetical protein